LDDKVKAGDTLGVLYDTDNLEESEVIAPESGYLFKFGRMGLMNKTPDPAQAFHPFADTGEILIVVAKT
jgi:predicted deacylase